MRTTPPSIMRRHSASPPRPAFSSPRSLSARSTCASVRWSIPFRSTIRCGWRRRFACSTSSAQGASSSASAAASRRSKPPITGSTPTTDRKCIEALQILRQALTGRTLTFHGEFYHYADVPIELEPFQKPHPPFWAGAGTPDGAEAAGRNGFHLVANALTSQIRTMTERYRAAFKAAHTPMLGLARFVIMGETDAEALTIARRAYPLWHRHFHHLFHMHGTSPAGGERPPHFDQIKDGGRGIAGSPATVTRMIKAQMEEAGTNYFVGQFAFGDLTLAEVLRTVDLFAREVMPALTDA